MSIHIDQPILTQIQKHLESAYPFEACGFLLGSDKSRKRYVTEIIEVENKSIENQKRRFVIDPLEYMKAEKYALRQGLQLLGIYHSHPDHPAIPSLHDLEFAQPYFSYFISSIQQGTHSETKSFRLLNGEFIEEKFSLLKNHAVDVTSKVYTTA
ncbi:MAG: M67 family metallopeptidase [Bacteroidota bacterium]|nr:M67 family metallopeptidase [Bacteroidota bacterium]